MSQGMCADGLPVVVAVSTAILGPYDFKPSRMGQVLIRFASGRLRAYVPGGFPFVAAADIVEGHVLAKQNPAAPIWGRSPHVVGSRLLASGFWGIGRKLNYTGEFLMYVSWTLMAGFQSAVPIWSPSGCFCCCNAPRATTGAAVRNTAGCGTSIAGPPGSGCSRISIEDA
jgi:protein-S-isoprenylcysteine O-methyltransferase Ste14